MSEAEIIDKYKAAPVTVDSLTSDFKSLGIKPGMILIVHSSLSSLGWVCGGPVAVILSLQNIIRPYGTIVMPAHSGDLSDPSGWSNPPVPKTWWDTIRKTMPGFDPDLTPTRRMGAIPECFRKQHNVLRSSHPQVSFTAWGENSINILQGHSLSFSLGEESPLARIYELDGWIMLLGVDHSSNTSLHLSEHRAVYSKKKEIECSSPVIINNHRKWKRYRDIEYNSSDFKLIGKDFERGNKSVIKTGRIGFAKARLFQQRFCVDYAVKWMEKNRK